VGDSGVGGRAKVSDTFSVGVFTGQVGGAGRLIVEPGRIMLEPARLTRSVVPAFDPANPTGRIVHTDPVVVLMKARLVPPWCNTSVLLHDDQTWGYATTRGWDRARLRNSI